MSILQHESSGDLQAGPGRVNRADVESLMALLIRDAGDMAAVCVDRDNDSVVAARGVDGFFGAAEGVAAGEPFAGFRERVCSRLQPDPGGLRTDGVWRTRMNSGDTEEIGIEIREWPGAERFALIVFRRDAIQKHDVACVPEERLLLDHVLRKLPVGIAVIDAQRRILRVSDAACAIVGRSRAELVGATTRILYADDVEFERVGRLLYPADGEPVLAKALHVSGVTLDVEITMAAADSSVSVPTFISAIRDVTRLNELSSELQRYRQIVEASSDALVFVDPQFRYRAANQVYLDFWQMESDFIVGRTVEEVVGKELFESVVRPRLARCLGGEHDVVYVDHVDFLPGRPRYVEATYNPYVDESGDVGGVVVNIRDVSERMEAQQALQRSERRASDLLVAMPDMMLRFDREGIVRDAKSAWQQEGFRGLNAEAGESLYSMWPKEPVDRAVALLDEQLVRNEPRSFEVETIDAFGEARFFEWRVVAHQADEATVTVRDITAQRRESSELSMMSQIVEQSPDAVLVTDDSFRVTHVNPSFERLFGWSLQDLHGDTPQRLNAEPDADERQREIYRRLCAGETVFDEAMNRRKDGSVFRCQFWVSPLRDEFGNVSGYVGSQRDVTERVEAERALAHSQRMEEIGRLSGGIAHDFNNILGSVLGFSELAQLRIESGDERVSGYLSQIQSAALRARELVRQLLVFSRGAPTEVRNSTPLNLMVQEAVALLRPLMPPMVDVQIRFSEPSPQVRVDPLHVQQIIINLGVNARDAMYDKGTLRLSVDTASLHGGILCAIGRSPVVGDWARVKVCDNGQGIPAEILDRIFDPFFTTKPVGAGSGMGLAVVAGLVRGYKGHIVVETGRGEGTCFSLLFPVNGTADDVERGSEAGSIE